MRATSQLRKEMTELNEKEQQRQMRKTKRKLICSLLNSGSNRKTEPNLKVLPLNLKTDHHFSDPETFQSAAAVTPAPRQTEERRLIFSLKSNTEKEQLFEVKMLPL